MKTRQAVGRPCGQDGCKGPAMKLRTVVRALEVHLGGENCELTTELDEAFCPGCGYTFRGSDAQAMEMETAYAFESDYWVETLKAAGAGAAEIIKLKMIVHRAVLDCPDPPEAARQLGVWLARREETTVNGRKH